MIDRNASRRFAWMRLRVLGLCLGIWMLVWGEACNCESENVGVAFSLDVKISQPVTGPISGEVPMDISVVDALTKQVAQVKDVRFVQVYLTEQGKGDVSQRQIAEIHTQPYAFRWSSIQVEDGFYLLRAVAFDATGREHESRRVLVQVVNQAPELWFVNCYDGQFVRGTYSLTVSLHQPKIELKEPPKLSINGLQGPTTEDKKHPYRYAIDTSKYQEGEQLALSVEAEDLRGNHRRINCYPRVDNILPTVRFVKPEKDGALLGRTFRVEFEAFDQFGIREIRLLVDGSACAQDRKDPDPQCAKNAPWVGKDAPRYPITVTLSEDYNSEQTISLTARAIDLAGNASDPPARLQVRIDPVAPEIFIRAPGQGQVVNQEVTFTARITDNDQIEQVTFMVEGGPTPVTVLQQNPGKSELTLTYVEADAVKAFGRGRRNLVVIAQDRSGNKTEVKRLFNVGCSDSADCPVGQVCHKFICKVPVGLNEPCDDDHPCALQSSCVSGTAPICGGSKATYCRLRCNPGNKVVSPDPCPAGFYCDQDTQTCKPGDGCTPLADTCGSAQQCAPIDDDTNICLPVGPVYLGQPCQEDCTLAGNCSRGYWCVFNLVNARHTCMQACDTRKSNSCPGGQVCLALRWSFGGAPLVYGVCISNN